MTWFFVLLFHVNLEPVDNLLGDFIAFFHFLAQLSIFFHVNFDRLKETNHMVCHNGTRQTGSGLIFLGNQKHLILTYPNVIFK